MNDTDLIVQNGNPEQPSETFGDMMEYLRKKFGWKYDGEEGFYNACLYAIVSFTESGYVEASPIFEECKKFFCDYCRGLHSTESCDRR